MNSDIVSPTATAVKVPVVAVKFWYAGYDPEKALDLFTAATVPLEAKATDNLLRQWQPAKANATLDDVRIYAQDNRLKVLRHELIAERHEAKRWQGLYILVLGKVM